MYTLNKGTFLRDPNMRFWLPFQKVEDNEDGTITVAGIASSEAVDSDGEIITADAMRAAIPDYMKFGAVREMHQPIAAGTAVSCEVQDDGKTYIEALVVDSESVKKVKAGVLKGFSIGGKVQTRNKKDRKIIEAIKLVEVSLVDRPANPEAIIGLVKMEDTDVDPEQETPVAPVVEKAAELEDLKKFLGEEVWDAARAVEALGTIMSLLGREMSEDEQMPEQITALREAAAKIKEFIASEIMEDNSGDEPGVIMLADSAEVVEAGGIDTEKVAERKDVNPKEGENEYGDVAFADAKNKKYPIDTEAHIRAAWNYINKPKNAAKYSDKDLKSIKSRIVAAWKKKISKDGPPSAAKAEEAEPLAPAVEDVDVGKAVTAESIATLNDLHKSAMAMHRELGKCLKSFSKCWGTEKAEAGDDLTKAEGLGEELAKAHSERDEALQKAATLQEELNVLKGSMKPLKAVPVEKSADTAMKSEASVSEPEANDPLSAMRKVHATGGRLITTTRLG